MRRCRGLLPSSLGWETPASWSSSSTAHTSLVNPIPPHPPRLPLATDRGLILSPEPYDVSLFLPFPAAVHFIWMSSSAQRNPALACCRDLAHRTGGSLHVIDISQPSQSMVREVDLLVEHHCTLPPKTFIIIICHFYYFLSVRLSRHTSHPFASFQMPSPSPHLNLAPFPLNSRCGQAPGSFRSKSSERSRQHSPLWVLCPVTRSTTCRPSPGTLWQVTLFPSF